ncbi:MAG: TRAP transporter substrate-binding protein [Betaproteobacteria bacterium]|nr:TRAP transporter substrate-binding protein [Betaproteobacteria bacterium]
MNTIIGIKKWVGVLGAAALAGTLAAPAAAQNVMKLSTATINDVQHEWMKRFAADVEKASKGRIKPEIYPASQLGAIPRQIEGTQFGSIQAYIGPPEFLTGLDSRYELLSAPGLFKDSEHASRTLNDREFKAAFLALGANKGLKGIGLFLYGPLMFNTRTPVRTLADFEGLKVRVLAGAMQMNQMRRLKGTPVPMSLGEVLPAVRQGALDGSMSAQPVFTAFRYWDAAKYIYESNHGIVTSIAVYASGPRTAHEADAADRRRGDRREAAGKGDVRTPAESGQADRVSRQRAADARNLTLS